MYSPVSHGKVVVDIVESVLDDTVLGRDVAEGRGDARVVEPRVQTRTDISPELMKQKPRDLTACCSCSPSHQRP